jgi:putative endonuclease
LIILPIFKCCIFCNLDYIIELSIICQSMRIRVYYVYILANAHHTVLYTGVINDLERRLHEHKQKKIKGFTKKYNVDKLIYFESFDSIDSAIGREKQIKGFSRVKKLALINNVNEHWKELSHTGLFRTQ